MTHFYLTLPSNSSMDTYPGNTLTHYVTKLQVPVSLAGDWEIALEEISLPKSWYQIPKGEGRWTVERDVWYGLNEGQTGERISRTYQLSHQGIDYQTIDDVVRTMTTRMVNHLTEREFKVTNADGTVEMKRLTQQTVPRFAYRPELKRVRIHLPYGFTIHMTDTLRAMLKFDRG